MDPLIGSALISSGANLLGGLIGGGKSALKQMHQQREVNYMAQRDLDRNRASWLVTGAKKGGVHPLTVFGSPVAGQSAPLFSPTSDPNAGAAQALSAAGQGISGAVQAWNSREDRQLQAASAKLALENQQLQNERLRSEINLMNQPGRSMGMSSNPAIAGTNVPGTVIVPKELIQNFSGQEPGVRAVAQEFDYPGIGKVRHMSETAAEATEDDFLSKAMFALMYTAPDLFKNVWNNTRLMRQFNGRNLLPVFKERR